MMSNFNIIFFKNKLLQFIICFLNQRLEAAKLVSIVNTLFLIWVKIGLVCLVGLTRQYLFAYFYFIEIVNTLNVITKNYY